jgi:hypothetical protein
MSDLTKLEMALAQRDEARREVDLTKGHLIETQETLEQYMKGMEIAEARVKTMRAAARAAIEAIRAETIEECARVADNCIKSLYENYGAVETVGAHFAARRIRALKEKTWKEGELR